MRFVVGLLLLSAAAASLGPSPTVVAQEAGTPPHVTTDAQALLDELVPHVEKACSATVFPSPPRVRIVSAERAKAWFRTDLVTQIAFRYPSASEAQHRTLLELAASASAASCLARYSWSAKAILIVPESFDRQRAAAAFEEKDARDLLRAVLAHEAIHALDDQTFDLGEAFSIRCPTPEALRALSMAVEGRAVHYGRIAARRAGVSERARMLLPGGERPRDAGAWTLRLTYEAGAAFVAQVDGREGENRNAAWRDTQSAVLNPPATTHEIFHPLRWRQLRLTQRDEEVGPDPRPAERLRAAGLTKKPDTISELQLRARYAALLGADRSAALFEGFRGGAQVLADATNVAVLAFADEDAAERYVEIAGKEAPTERHGTLVLRAFGPAADALLERLRPNGR